MTTTTPLPKDDFLQRLDSHITTRLYEPTFDVGRLLRIVGMSRTDLHRKLKASTGMSATAYIRRLRLQRAAVLLREQQQWSLYQIALEVGFSSQSYFTRKFKEQFHICPLAYRLMQHTAWPDL